MDDIHTLGIDIETYSSVDLNSCGVHRYVEAEDFTILLFGYSVNCGPVKCVDFASGEELPEEIYNALWDPSVEKTAYNAPFERTCIGKYYGKYCDPKQWSCTMVLALTCGLPLSLKQVGEALELGEDKAKMTEGAALIRYFCGPCNPTKANGGRTRNLPEDAPDKWEVFKKYNIRDVEVETTIRQRLLKWRPDRSEQRFWELDQHINDVGIKVDVEFATQAVAMGNEYKKGLMEQAKEISGLENPRSPSQVKAWLEQQEDVQVLTIDKKVIADLIAKLKDEDTKKFLALREEFAKSSVMKYVSVLRCACADGHARGLFQFYGAGRTGRFAGRLIQLQNLPQNHMEDLDAARYIVKSGDYATFTCLYEKPQATLSELIRTTLIPEDGHRFIVADFSAIEARVISFLAGEDWVLDTFRKGGDIYCATASKMFKVPVEKHGQNSGLRQKGKIATLALGYGGGVGALKAFGADKLGMSEEEMVQTVDMWREASPHIVALWKSLERAVKKCIISGKPTVDDVGNTRFDMEDGVLWMTLRSGRRIAYWGASLGKNRWGQSSIVYMGLNQATHKWDQIETFGGKLAENLVQATARDVLREAMFHLADHGYDVRATVHDEVIITCPIGAGSLDHVIKLMCEGAPWTDGLPLNADGYECESYRKA